MESVWAGELKAFQDGSHTVPIVNSVTFVYNDLDEWYEVAKGDIEGHI